MKDKPHPGKHVYWVARHPVLLMFRLFSLYNWKFYLTGCYRLMKPLRSVLRFIPQTYSAHPLYASSKVQSELLLFFSIVGGGCYSLSHTTYKPVWVKELPQLPYQVAHFKWLIILLSWMILLLTSEVIRFCETLEVSRTHFHQKKLPTVYSYIRNAIEPLSIA